MRKAVVGLKEISLNAEFTHPVVSETTLLNPKSSVNIKDWLKTQKEKCGK